MSDKDLLWLLAITVAILFTYMVYLLDSISKKNREIVRLKDFITVKAEVNKYLRDRLTRANSDNYRYKIRLSRLGHLVCLCGRSFDLKSIFTHVIDGE